MTLDGRRQRLRPCAPSRARGATAAPPHPSSLGLGSGSGRCGAGILLVGSVLLVRQVTVERPQTQLGAVGEPTTETLLDATLTGAAETWTPLAVERWRFQPGATLTIPPWTARSGSWPIPDRSWPP